MPHLKIHNLVKRFDGKKGRSSLAVNGVTLEVEKGEFIILLGPSGCGKTTVLRMIAGLEHPTSGTINIGGQDVTTLPPNKRNTAMVFQHYALFPHMDLFHNVEFGLKYKKQMTREARHDETLRMLKLVGLENLERRMPSELSGGQQQRVALARALVIKPEVLLCDEPLSNLDADLRLQMRTEIKRLHQQTGATTLYVTHDHEEAQSLADRIIKMKDGSITQEIRKGS